MCVCVCCVCCVLCVGGCTCVQPNSLAQVDKHGTFGTFHEKTERFTPLLRTYAQVSFRFYSKNKPYYEFSGSILTKRVNKKTYG